MLTQRHLSTTYIKVLGKDPEMMRVLKRVLGDRTHRILLKEYVYEDDIEAVFQAFADAGLASWILRFGDQISVGSHGSMGFAVMSAPDLHTALNVLAKFTIIRSSIYQATIVYQDNRVEYQIANRSNSPLVERWLIESGLRVVQKLIETIIAHPLGDNAVIRFALSAPDYSEELARFFGVRCEFNAKQNAISIPASWCKIPSPLSDPATFETNLRKCKEQKRLLEGGVSIVESARSTIDRYFANRAQSNIPEDTLPTLGSLAANHNMSNRTFARKLAAEQQSYKKLLEVARKEQALLLLKTTHLTIAEIADRLSYQEPASFIRAFNSWFNTSPTQWRRSPHD